MTSSSRNPLSFQSSCDFYSDSESRKVDYGYSQREGGASSNSNGGKCCTLSGSISIVLLFVILLNGVLCVTLICFIAVSQEELQALMKAINSKLDQPIREITYPIDDSNTAPPFIVEMDDDLVSDALKGNYMARVTDRSDCRCPTCAPLIEIPTNKDPVSFINQEFGLKATFTCATVCLHPAINTAELVIEGYQSKTWNGRAATKKFAKHEAAYDALKELKPELLEQVEHNELDYNPKCNDKIFTPIDFSGSKKC